MNRLIGVAVCALVMAACGSSNENAPKKAPVLMVKKANPWTPT